MFASLALIVALQAAAANYRFEPSSPVIRGVAAKVTVQVTDTNGRALPRLAVSDANISRDGASRPAFFEPSLEYGSLRFRADLPTSGDWVLNFTLQAGSDNAQPVAVAFKVNDPVRPDATAPRR